MSVRILQVVSFCLSEYYRLCQYFGPQIAGCIGKFVRILQAVSVFVSILHVVSVCLPEYYMLCPYCCPNITGCIRMYVRMIHVVSVSCVRILQVVSVFLSAFTRCMLYPYFCPYITGCFRIYVRIIHVVSVFLSAFTRCIRMSVRKLQVVFVRMPVRALQVVSVFVRILQMYPYVCPYDTRCIRISVRILQVVTAFLSALTRIRLSVRILQVVSVRMSVRILQVVCVCPRVTGSLLSACTELFPSVCLSANYRYCSLYATGSEHVSPDPTDSVACFRIFQVASLSKGTDSQRHCCVGDSHRPAAHTGSLYNSVSFRVPIFKTPGC